MLAWEMIVVTLVVRRFAAWIVLDWDLGVWQNGLRNGVGIELHGQKDFRLACSTQIWILLTSTDSAYSYPPELSSVSANWVFSAGGTLDP